MKKFLLFAATAFFFINSYSQDKLFSKNGKTILPEKKDFSLGLDASPIFNYIGNLFNDNGTNSLDSLGSAVPLTVTGKYFIRDNRAIRGSFGIRVSNFSNEIIVDDATNNDSTFTKTDETIDKSISLVLSGGLEFRRGFGRLQAFYGPQIQISYSESNTSFSYGNAIADAAPNGTPSSLVRITESEQGALLGVSLGGFIGVEYFFAPRISFSAELGLNVKYEVQGNGKETFETFERTTFFIFPITTEGETTVSTGGSSLFEIDTRPNAGIGLNFYF